MKKMALALVLTPAVWGCTSLSPQGAQVKVYQANVAAADAPAPALPPGCRLQGSWGPITEQTQERFVEDPYRVERNEAAGKGGNVLLVKSYRFMTKPKTDCPMGDNSPGCGDTAQNWYKTSFDAFACDTAGLQALSELKPGSDPDLLGVLFAGKKKEAAPAPAASAAPAASEAPAAPARAAAAAASAASLKSKILALVQEGVGADVILAYVRANRLASPLTAEEIIDWKKSGISDELIRATFRD